MIGFDIKTRTNGELSKGKKTTEHKFSWIQNFLDTNWKAHISNFEMSTMF